MIFSARHYSALNRVYSRMFDPVPEQVAQEAARGGKAPELMDALQRATQRGQPVQDWTPYAPEYRESSRLTATAD